jgi:glycine cleavage system aminomethyltransferase T
MEKLSARTPVGSSAYTVDKSLVLGYVAAERAAADTFEVESFGTRSPAVSIQRAAYDPDRTKILC